MPVVPVIFMLALVGGELAYAARVHPAESQDKNTIGNVIGNEDLYVDGVAIVNDTSPIGELSEEKPDDNFAGFVFVEKSSLVNPSTPISDTVPLRNGLLSYKIKEGDNVSVVAAHFGISINTIIWANDIKNTNLIQPGQEIVILPVSGVLHKVKDGETLQSIAKLYNISSDKIRTFNKDKIKQGDTVIVPQARPIKSSTAGLINKSTLPRIAGYFAMPIKNGWNWGELHDNNAVDISAACKSPIYAAADGIVVNLGSPIRWNGGYGGFVKIKHPNGTKTLYAHISKGLVSIGDTVEQGELIAKVGNTGRVSGSTGCHVHFAVYGAQNPFAE